MPTINGISYPREHNGVVIRRPSDWPGGKPPAALVEAYTGKRPKQDPPDDSNAGDGGGDLVNINTATAAELSAAISGVGDETAADIIGQRPFKSVDDLVRVGGIGKGTVNKHRHLLTV